MAFFAKCICYNRRSWKKKAVGGRHAGALRLSATQYSNKVRQDCFVLSPTQTFHTWKRPEITVWSYGMYPKWALMTKNWDCLFFHTSTSPLPPAIQAHPPAEVQSLIKGQQRCSFKARRGAAMGGETLFQTFLLSKLSVCLISLESQVASFPPTNGSLDQYWMENQSGHSLFRWGKAVSAFIPLELMRQILVWTNARTKVTQRDSKHTTNLADIKNQCIAVYFPPE